MKDLKNCQIEFKEGDAVVATALITRVDKRSYLLPGERATVWQVWRTTQESPQIISLKIEGRAPMGDIVCFENVPLRLA